MKIKKGDTVVMLSGKDRGREAKVEKVLVKENRLLLPGLNQYKKHRKPAQGQPGEIVTLSRPVTVAKVALVCPKCKKPTRVGFQISGDKKLRICRKCKAQID